MGLEIKIPKFKFPKFKFKEIDDVEDINLEKENDKIAKDVITRCNIDKDSIDALIFVTQTNDSVAPASVFVMQDKLGLSANCYLNNITNGCAGSVHGIFEGAYAGYFDIEWRRAHKI